MNNKTSRINLVHEEVKMVRFLFFLGAVFSSHTLANLPRCEHFRGTDNYSIVKRHILDHTELILALPYETYGQYWYLDNRVEVERVGFWRVFNKNHFELKIFLNQQTLGPRIICAGRVDPHESSPEWGIMSLNCEDTMPISVYEPELLSLSMDLHLRRCIYRSRGLRIHRH